MAKKVAVVIRQLRGSRPVTSAVIQSTNDPDVDDQEHYLKSEAESCIRRLKEDYIEFQAAEFYIDILDSQ